MNGTGEDARREASAFSVTGAGNTAIASAHAPSLADTSSPRARPIPDTGVDARWWIAAVAFGAAIWALTLLAV